MAFFLPTRALRWMVLACLAVVLVATGKAYLSRRAATLHVPPRPAVMAAGVDQQTQAFSMSRTLADHTVYTIRAEQVTNFKDSGKSLLHGVTIFIFGKGGTRHDRISAAACEYDSTASTVFVPGQVQMQFSVPLQPGSPPPSSSSATPVSGPSTPIQVVTSALKFDQSSGVADTDADAHFQFNQGQGTAHGARYDPRGETITLKSAVDFDLTNFHPHSPDAAPEKAEIADKTEKKDTPPTRVQAGSLRFIRAQGKLLLDNSVEITQGTRQITADHAEIELDSSYRAQQAWLSGDLTAHDSAPDYTSEARAGNGHVVFNAQGKVAQLELDDAVEWKVHSLSSGQVREGRSQQLVLSFDQSSNLLRNVHAGGQVRMVLSGTHQGQTAAGRADAGAAKLQTSSQTVTGEQAELSLRPDGKTLQSAQIDSGAKMILEPAVAGGDRRTISAGHFDLQFNAQGMLSGFSANDRVRTLAESTGTAHGQRVTSSDFLQAAFTPQTGALQHARQWGHFTYSDADRQARADQGEYGAAEETMTLKGNPVMWSSQSQLRADHIELGTASGVMKADGNILSTYFPSASGGKPAPEPVHVVADHMQYFRAEDRAEYQGHARLWQGDQFMVESNSIELLQKEGELRADRQVYSVFLNVPPPQSNPSAPTAGTADDAPASSSGTEAEANGGAASSSSSKTESGNTEPGKAQPGAYEIRADSLLYDQHNHEAHYTGGVSMENSLGSLAASELDLFFDAANQSNSAVFSTQAGALQRAVATKQVRIVDGRRTATGDRAEYLPQEQLVHLWGDQAEVSDPLTGTTKGSQLTYLLQGDSMQVEGKPDSRTETRGRVHP